MALLLSLLVPSSPAMRRRKANGNKNMKTTVKVVITPTISTKETTKKVKFQIPSDAFVALYSAAAVDHRRKIFRDGKQQQQQQQVSDRRKQKNKQGEEKDQHQQSTDNDYYYNPWYTSKELISFRQDVWITSHWMVLNGIGSHSHRSKTTTRRNNNTLGTVLFNKKKGLFNQRYHQGNYVFCSRGMEGRTPIAKLFKIKRRKDAMQSVLAFQNQRCTAQAEQQIEMDNVDDNDDVEGDDENCVKALAKVYTSYCQQSRSIALYLGRENSIEAAEITIATESSSDERIKETQRPMMNNHNNNKKYILLPANDDIVHHNNSLCDDSDSDSDSDNNDYNHDSNGSSIRHSYSVALSVTTNPTKDSIPSPMKGRRRRRRRSTVPTPSSSSFCNDYHSHYYNYQHDYNHYRYDCDYDYDYDYDVEEESDVERELFGGGLISSICSSNASSKSSFSSSSISVSSSALSTKTIAEPPKSPAPSTSSSLVLDGRSSTTTTTTTTPIGLLSELIADVVGTTTKTVPTTTDGPPSSVPSSSSSSHPLSPTSFLLSKVSCLSSRI